MHKKRNCNYLWVAAGIIAAVGLCSSVPIAREQADSATEMLRSLYASVMSGNITEVLRLIEAGADVNVSSESGRTPLHAAALMGHTDIVRLLLEADAKVNSKDEADTTALILASQHGHTEIVKLLIDAEAKLNSKTKRGTTALNLALQNGHTEIVRLLLDAGAKMNAYANSDLGIMYLQGKGVARDYKEAEMWFRKAAKKGVSAAQVNLGIMYLQGKGVAQNYKEAEKWFRKAAKKEVSTAQANLGIMYLQGKGVPRDYKEAEKWFRKAVKKRTPAAQANLGIMYFHGYGVPRDYEEAEKLFLKAAEHGDSVAQYMLGEIYAEGLHVAKDYIQAYVWLTFAIAGSTNGQNQTLQKATDLRDSFVGKMTPRQIDEAERLAKEWELTKFYVLENVAHRAESGVSEPVAVRSPMPPYTEQARNARATGSVFMRCLIRKDGSVNNCMITRELGYGLDESTLETIENKWLFKPATYKGKPVDIQVDIETNFSIY